MFWEKAKELRQTHVWDPGTREYLVYKRLKSLWSLSINLCTSVTNIPRTQNTHLHNLNATSSASGLPPRWPQWLDPGLRVCLSTYTIIPPDDNDLHWWPIKKICYRLHLQTPASDPAHTQTVSWRYVASHIVHLAPLNLSPWQRDIMSAATDCHSTLMTVLLKIVAAEMELPIKQNGPFPMYVKCSCYVLSWF